MFCTKRITSVLSPALLVIIQWCPSAAGVQVIAAPGCPSTWSDFWSCLIGAPPQCRNESSKKSVVDEHEECVEHTRKAAQQQEQHQNQRGPNSSSCSWADFWSCRITVPHNRHNGCCQIEEGRGLQDLVHEVEDKCCNKEDERMLRLQGNLQSAGSIPAEVTIIVKKMSPCQPRLGRFSFPLQRTATLFNIAAEVAEREHVSPAWVHLFTRDGKTAFEDRSQKVQGALELAGRETETDLDLIYWIRNPEEDSEDSEELVDGIHSSFF